MLPELLELDHRQQTGAGPAPGITWNGAGAWLIFSQSRQVNFLRITAGRVMHDFGAKNFAQRGRISTINHVIVTREQSPYSQPVWWPDRQRATFAGRSAPARMPPPYSREM